MMRNMAKIWRNLLALVYHQIYFLEELIVTRKRKKRSKKYIGRWPDIFIDPEKPCTWR